jgi:hypothetical protein
VIRICATIRIEVGISSNKRTGEKKNGKHYRYYQESG